MAPSDAPPPNDFEHDEGPAALRRQVATLKLELSVLRQELALRQSNTEATYRAVFDAVNEAILILDLATGAVADLNRTAERLTGYGRDDLLGQPLATLAGDEARLAVSFSRSSPLPVLPVSLP